MQDILIGGSGKRKAVASRQRTFVCPLVILCACLRDHLLLLGHVICSGLRIGRHPAE
jgi:hypothetical protein